MQIVFTPKKWAFLFPRKDSWHSSMAVTSLATMLVVSCFCAGARELPGLLPQLITVEPYAGVLHISMNAHLKPCPTIANLGQKRISVVVQSLCGSITGSSRRNSCCRGTSQGVIPIAPPWSAIWAIAEQTQLQGMCLLALSILTLQISQTPGVRELHWNLAANFQERCLTLLFQPPDSLY